MAKGVENHLDGADDEAWPVEALAGKLPPIEIADIKAARREVLLGEGPARNPDFPATAESYHDRRLARRLEKDPEFRAEFERQQQAIAAGRDRRRSERA